MKKLLRKAGIGLPSKGIPGYVGVILRWREKNDRHGYPPPRYDASMPAFTIKSRVVSEVSEMAWENHANFMRNTYDSDFLDNVYHGEYTREYEKI